MRDGKMYCGHCGGQIVESKSIWEEVGRKFLERTVRAPDEFTPSYRRRDTESAVVLDNPPRSRRG